MRLSIDVIEEVRKEIGRAQDVSLRPTLTKIRGLTQSQLSALNTLVACDQRATLAEIQGLEYVLEGTAGQSRTELGEAFEHFQKLGILATDTDAIRFLGDEFDKIYVKYFAREREILFSFPDLTPERLFRRRMQRLPNPRIAMQLSWYDSDLVRDVDESTSAFAIDQYNAVSLSRFVYSQTVTRATETAIAYKKDRQSTITVVRTRAHLPWFNTTLYCAPQDPGNVAVLDDWLLAVESVRQRVEELEGSLETEKRWLAPVPVEAIVEKAESLGPPAAKQVGELTFPGLMKSFIDRYMESGMAAEVLAHANLAYRYLPSRPASDNVIIPHLNTALNSIGYVFMAAGEIERAREVLGKGLTVAEDANDVAILRYNLGLCEAISGNLEKALDHIGSSIELTSPTAPEFLCLFRPVTVDGTLVLDEIREHPRLLDVASEAQVTLSAPFHE